MKLWKKVYLFALIIITLCVNLGFLGIVYMTYDYMLRAERERCEAEYVVLSKNIAADLERLELAMKLDADYFTRYVMAYGSYYQTDTKLIALVNGEVTTENGAYKNLPQTDGVFIFEEEQTTIYVSQRLSEKHSHYRIVMRRTLKDFDNMWDKLLPLYFGGGVLLSLGVSCLLAIAVRVLLRPMDKLEVLTKQLQEENWSARVQMKGKDELAQLGSQFNVMAGVIEDNIEELKKQAEQKQELVNNLSHEMNTPITSIQGFAEYMQLTDISKAEQSECLDFIIEESCRLKEISSTLLMMADMQSEQEIPRETFGMKDLCCKLEEVYQMQFAQEHIVWKVVCEDVKMNGNPMLIESLFRNLITNAHRAVLGKKEKSIELRVFSENQKLIIWVTDNGCGIEERHREQIFEPFYRVDKARSREHGGSGLGLPFCKEIVELHKGEISVASKWGEGSRFTIIFTI